jgi:hypothetical protein
LLFLQACPPAFLRFSFSVHLSVLCRYWTLAELFTHETEIKKSQFIATAWPVASAAEVRKSHASLSQTMPAIANQETLTVAFQAWLHCWICATWL